MPGGGPAFPVACCRAHWTGCSARLHLCPPPGLPAGASDAPAPIPRRGHADAPPPICLVRLGAPSPCATPSPPLGGDGGRDRITAARRVPGLAHIRAGHNAHRPQSGGCVGQVRVGRPVPCHSHRPRQSLQNAHPGRGDSSRFTQIPILGRRCAPPRSGRGMAALQ